jgi:peroxiredoxin
MNYPGSIYIAACLSLTALPAMPADTGGPEHSSASRLVLLDGCSDSSEIGVITPATPVKVRYSLAGESTPCWAVTTVVDGRPVQGHLIDRRHPAIEAFERDTAARVPMLPPPPAPPAPAVVEVKAPVVVHDPLPLSFKGFRATDIAGNRLDLSRLPAKTVVLYFWSPDNRKSVKEMDAVAYIHEQYSAKGVDVIGIAASGSALKVRAVCNQNEAVWPQVLDESGFVAKDHNVSPEKPYLVLDRDRNVVVAASHASELDPVLQKRIR